MSRPFFVRQSEFAKLLYHIFLEICEKILLNCQDHHICFNALNMKAKIAQAEGKTEDALTIYKKHFVAKKRIRIAEKRAN